VLIGSFNDVRNCYIRPSQTEPAVTFADGGPPEPPVPIGKPEAGSVNGVAVLVTTADVDGGCRCGADGSEHEFMAVFPQWKAWLRVGMKADRRTTLEAGNALLNTIRATPDREPPPRPPVRSFLGHWHVHGTVLDIGPREARLTVDCHRPQPCIETFTLAVALSQDGRRLDAEVTNDTWSDPTTGRPVPPDPSTDGLELGDTSSFEFVAPHLLKETYLRTADPNFDDYGNPYWCGEDLDPSFDHCGL
jgi:hypothetical protein